jgi:Ca2+-binding RTX toxin-like protein
MAIAPTDILLSNRRFSANDDSIVGILTVTDPDTPISDIVLTVDDARFEIVADYSDGPGTVFLLKVVDGIDTIDPGDVAINVTATAPDGALVTPFTLTALAQTQAETDGNDKFKGTNGVDVVDGLGGDDTLNGKNGNDLLNGGLGDDDLNGGNGRDVLYGEDGDDTIFGGNGSDLLVGGDGNDFLSGGNSSDTLVGGAGDDTLIGGNGADLLNGGADNDTLIGGNAKDTLAGGDGDDVLFGGNGKDALSGDGGNDQLDGGNGVDQLLGGAGDDVLSGGRGSDTLNGGTGNDTLTGGLARDYFVFDSVDFGIDTVTDFVVGLDKLKIDDTVFATAANVLANAAQVGSDTVITLDVSNTFTLENVALANLSESDILIV